MDAPPIDPPGPDMPSADVSPDRAAGHAAGRVIDHVTVRPGGRSARIRRDVLGATLQLLAAGGYGAVTVDAVATRAGVHRTTVHRRWGTPIALVLDALFERSDDVIGRIDTGSLEGDVRTLVTAVRANLESPVGRAASVALAAERGDEVAAGARRFWDHRFDAVAPIVHRAVERGELDPQDATDPARWLERCVAPLFFRVLVQHREIDDPMVDEVVHAMARPIRSREDRGVDVTESPAITVTVTCADRAEADRIADRLVADGLAACVHLTELDSVYTWEGAVEREHEVQVSITTTRSRRRDVVDTIESLHSYDLPAIGWRTLEGTPAYLDWVVRAVETGRDADRDQMRSK